MNNFSDIDFLWEPSGARGQSRVDLEEGRFLFGLAQSIKSPFIVEIGRLRGGTTILLSKANEEGTVLSIELHNDYPFFSDQMESLGIKNIILATGDSKTFPNEHLNVDLLFIDGDHSEEGCLADFYHWFPKVKSGGHIVLHDASGYNSDIGCVEAVKEILNKNYSMKRCEDVLSMVHFIKL